MTTNSTTNSTTTVTAASSRVTAAAPFAAPPAASFAAAIDAACARIAPAWPLDRLIAVNPYWGWVDRPIEEVAERLGALEGARFVMPRAWFRTLRDEGRLDDHDLARALADAGDARSPHDLRAALDADEPTPSPHPLVVDLRDALDARGHGATWRDLVLQSVGRSGEAWFDAAQAAWQPDRSAGLYGCWRALARADSAPAIVLDARGLARAVDDLPASTDELVAVALDTLGIARDEAEDYLTALLLSVRGWAAACAFRRWEARLAGRDDHAIVELLAVRLAWELLLFRTANGTDLPVRWRRARRQWREEHAATTGGNDVDWLLQRALELRYHRELAHRLERHSPIASSVVHAPAREPAHESAWAPAPAPAPTVPAVQAVFCIDVRSEVLRRHVETAAPDVATLGFAGFFGLPIAYAPVRGSARPQLPGLLAPAVIAHDEGPAADAARGQLGLRDAMAQATRTLFRSAPGALGVVEATGVGAAISLLAGSFRSTASAGDPLREGLDATSAAAVPRLTHRADGTSLDDEARAALAAGALRGMSLTRDFAPLVAFVGHGASVRNNPQAAGLACGACGGQSGELNARALAALLNDAGVRTRLVAQGIAIPDGTAFVGGVHDTVTEQVTLFPEPAVARTHAAELAAFGRALDAAGAPARRERATRLGRPGSSDPHAEAVRRASDWSEVRPEWALARNAAFICAPRARTRGLDLDGRTFLHEYRWQDDAGFATLEAILTAPVVVAHWINFQYYASTVDPERYGSGDKTLHNVVGGTLGVYEGAGGDLRIGLARQSVHDGQAFVHEPLRLGVYVEAPIEAIERVLARHAVVRQLVSHRWIFLHQLSPDDGRVRLWRPDGWVPMT